MRTRFQLVVTLVAATSTTGCSLVLTHGPRDQPPIQATPGAPMPLQAMAPDCTTSMSWPTVDAIVSGIAVLAAISASNGSRDPSTNNANNNDAVAPLLVIGVTAAVSGIIGYQRVNKCRKATETYASQYTYPQAGYPYAQQQPYNYQYPQQQPYQQPYQPYPQQPYVGPTPPPGQQPSVQQTPPPPPPQPQPVVVKPPPPAPPAPKPAPAPKPPVPAPAPKPAELGTEGDVCTSQSECATGYGCTNNVCLRKK